MTTDAPSVPANRQGGRAAWAPRNLPPLGVELTPQQQLACAFRVLARTGFSEHIAGHITMVDHDAGGMWVNPWGKWWEELSASDMCLVDGDGRVVRGEWDVTPAIHIHTELHRRRPDARVVVHNHPYHVSVLAALGVMPLIAHQTAAMFDGDLAFVEEYTGEVADPQLGASLADRIGDKSVVVLASHGIIVTGSSIEEATFRAYSVDRACRMTYDIVVSGRDPLEIPPSIREALKRSLLERGAEVFWNGAVRLLLRDQADVLE